MIELGTLGPVRVTLDGEPPPRALLWRKNLALLVYLARSPSRRRARSHLLGLLWGERPESAARHSLNEALRTLRRCGGEELVWSEGAQVALSDDLVSLDTDLLEAHLEEEEWEAAARLVRGEFLEGFGVPDASPFEDWMAAERLHWRRRSVAALVGWAEALLEAADLEGAAGAAARARALDPFSNAAVRSAMRTAALAGERASALALHEAFAARLAAELGVEPEPETLRLADRIRRERTWRLPEVVAPEEVAARRAPLVGRDGELRRALETWRTVCRERRAALLILEGEPGVGKTRLAEEIVARARLDGAILAGIRAVPSDLAAPWSAVVGLCRGGLEEAPGVAFAGPAALAAVAREIPEWEERFEEESAGAEPAPLGRALAEIVRSVAAEQPVLLLVDDAEWTDPESALALGGLLRDLEKAPLLLLISTTGYPPREEWDEVRSRLGREVAGRRIALEPLPRDALRQLARRVLSHYEEEALDRLTRRVEVDSAGLPLLATELLNAVRLGLAMERVDAGWPEPHRTLDQTLPGQLPDAVVAAIRIGFRRLTPDAQTTLSAAAVLGERVEGAALERATGLPPRRVAEALDELEWCRWLTAEPRGYSFVARIVRDVVAEDMLTPGQRRRILAAAGDS